MYGIAGSLAERQFRGGTCEASSHRQLPEHIVRKHSTRKSHKKERMPMAACVVVGWFRWRNEERSTETLELYPQRLSEIFLSSGWPVRTRMTGRLDRMESCR